MADRKFENSPIGPVIMRKGLGLTETDPVRELSGDDTIDQNYIPFNIKDLVNRYESSTAIFLCQTEDNLHGQDIIPDSRLLVRNRIRR